MKYQEMIDYIFTLIDEYKTDNISKEYFYETIHTFVSGNELEYSKK